MKVTAQSLRGVLLIETPIYTDRRGCFYEAFNAERFIAMTGVSRPFVQDNVSVSHKDVFRGMHLQREPYGQSKLIRVLSGSIIDIVLDVEEGSPTFGQAIAVPLRAHSGLSLYIPAGYAHGFIALEDDTVLQYKVDEYYHPETEVTYRYDAVLPLIARHIDPASLILSDKDLAGEALGRR